MSPSMEMENVPEPPAAPAGDREAFIRLFVRHQWQLYGFISTLLTSPADVDEVLQETSIILWSKFSEFRQDQSFLNWACGVAHLEVLRFYRKNRRRLLPLEEPVMEQLLAAQREQAPRTDHRRAALAECMKQLRPQDRELILRCYEPGVSFKEVAEQISRPINAVYKSLGRVRGWLHECINRRLSAEARQ
jgi:RNA polymerase sigma-70 factor (ECF subfamily)